MSYYTSYETSVALREAGAPQLAPQHEPTVYVLNWGIYWNSDGKDKPWLGARVGDDFSVRAWRLDEILEALEPHGLVILRRYGNGVEGYGCVVGCREPWPTEYVDSTPVEAAAACLLAVLRAARDVAR